MQTIEEGKPESQTDPDGETSRLPDLPDVPREEPGAEEGQPQAKKPKLDDDDAGHAPGEDKKI